MLSISSFVPVIIPHSSVPSCACYYEHRYGVECLCECHSLGAEFERAGMFLIGAVIVLIVVSFISRMFYNLFTSF